MDRVLITRVCKNQFSNRCTITDTTALGVWDEKNIDAIKNFPLLLAVAFKLIREIKRINVFSGSATCLPVRVSLLYVFENFAFGLLNMNESTLGPCQQAQSEKT